jgi:hypothetical protein
MHLKYRFFQIVDFMQKKNSQVDTYRDGSLWALGVSLASPARLAALPLLPWVWYRDC